VLKLPTHCNCPTRPGAPHSAKVPTTQRRVIMDRNSQPFRVLIVEDDADTAESLAVLLRLWGHDVTVCRSAPEALEVAPAYAPQAVLLDIGLPGMDGWEVARQLRRQGPVLLIGISGF